MNRMSRATAFGLIGLIAVGGTALGATSAQAAETQTRLGGHIVFTNGSSHLPLQLGSTKLSVGASASSVDAAATLGASATLPAVGTTGRTVLGGSDCLTATAFTLTRAACDPANGNQLFTTVRAGADTVRLETTEQTPRIVGAADGKVVLAPTWAEEHVFDIATGPLSTDTTPVPGDGARPAAALENVQAQLIGDAWIVGGTAEQGSTVTIAVAGTVLDSQRVSTGGTAKGLFAFSLDASNAGKSVVVTTTTTDGRTASQTVAIGTPTTEPAPGEPKPADPAPVTPAPAPTSTATPVAPVKLDVRKVPTSAIGTVDDTKREAALTLTGQAVAGSEFVVNTNGVIVKHSATSGTADITLTGLKVGKNTVYYRQASATSTTGAVSKTITVAAAPAPSPEPAPVKLDIRKAPTAVIGEVDSTKREAALVLTGQAVEGSEFVVNTNGVVKRYPASAGTADITLTGLKVGKNTVWYRQASDARTTGAVSTPLSVIPAPVTPAPAPEGTQPFVVGTGGDFVPTSFVSISFDASGNPVVRDEPDAASARKHGASLLFPSLGESGPVKDAESDTCLTVRGNGADAPLQMRACDTDNAINQDWTQLSDGRFVGGPNRAHLGFSTDASGAKTLVNAGREAGKIVGESAFYTGVSSSTTASVARGANGQAWISGTTLPNANVSVVSATYGEKAGKSTTSDAAGNYSIQVYAEDLFDGYRVHVKGDDKATADAYLEFNPISVITGGR